MSRRHAVITGAGGFVGRHLVDGFAALGWRVTGLDHAFDAPDRPAPAGVSMITADLASGVPDSLEAADLVVHAAAVTTAPRDLGWSASAHLEANLRPLLAVLAYVERTRPAALVFLSSSGVFAATDGTEWLRDTDTPSGRSPYAVAKRAGETLVEAARGPQTAVHVVRLGYLYGAHEAPRRTRQRVSLVARWLADARAHRPLVVRADDPRRDWTCAADLAPALHALVDGGDVGRPVHLGSAHVVRDRDLAALVAAHVPGVTIEMQPADGAVKPPMWPSVVPALAGFAWTTPADGIARLSGTEVAA
jgi:UDP-glucose 4-epimerase